MTRLALHKGLAWAETAWREPMLLWLAVSAAAHAGVVAFLMTPDTAEERVIDAGGAVAVEIVVVEGPELHAGAQSGEDRAQEAAETTALAKADPAPTSETAPEQNDQARPDETTPTETRDARAEEPLKPSQPAARLTAAPQAGGEPIAAAPTPRESPTPKQEPPRQASITPAPTPRRKPPPPALDMVTPSVAAPTAKADPQDTRSGGQNADQAPAHEQLSTATPSAGGTRGAAPRGDNPKPVYPFGARRRGEQGRVLLRVKVTPKGDAAAVTIAVSSGSKRLDDSALETVRRWRFQPARRGGTPVAAEVTVPIRFQLR